MNNYKDARELIINSKQRVMVFLNRQQVDFLDKIGKDALFTRGTKLSRIKIISCLVDLIRDLDINGEGISSLEDLRKRIEGRMGRKMQGN